VHVTQSVQPTGPIVHEKIGKLNGPKDIDKAILSPTCRAGLFGQSAASPQQQQWTDSPTSLATRPAPE